MLESFAPGGKAGSSSLIDIHLVRAIEKQIALHLADIIPQPLERSSHFRTESGQQCEMLEDVALIEFDRA